MSEQLIHIEFEAGRTLRDQVRAHLVSMILAGKIATDVALPSSRRMAEMLGVSRNTIMQIYEDLVDMEYLVSKPRLGYFVNTAFHEQEAMLSPVSASDGQELDWSTRFKTHPGNKRNIIKPSNWANFTYPFIYGQIATDLFPERSWRECGQKAMSQHSGKHWAFDWIDGDDPLLLEQLRSNILPRRGIYAEASEILVTIGTQNSLYMIANLLADKNTRVGLENPGFPDVKNIFSTFNAQLSFFDVDQDGLILNEESEAELARLDYLYLTPSHQVPTGAVMSSERRKRLMHLAELHDVVIIEDDYDAEINLQKEAQPALRAVDPQERVIYVGSMSKAIAPGVRLGFMVANEELISEARALRRLMYRHVPVHNQRQLALFISQGYFDSYLRKMRESYAHKLGLMEMAISRHLPQFKVLSHGSGATSLWLEAPVAVDTEQLSWRAAKNSILIEPGAIHFAGDDPRKNYLRLGFAAITADKIEPGIAALGRLLD
ncbi:PLP-dependent aminotransferase family protein [Halioxenophilus sp. WMMB6]|uniref:MocR-like pyridoxine biosynthesis transcription factor PdxR n=1 Tax=Halioxenophilus sp. WMMB6 TaxID=3073815 RepID=UPI00295E3929|nr:PLP-dependent aminotransferase family protein [Halioxenophilus sp. WMMB6]